MSFKYKNVLLCVFVCADVFPVRASAFPVYITVFCMYAGVFLVYVSVFSVYAGVCDLNHDNMLWTVSQV